MRYVGGKAGSGGVAGPARKVAKAILDHTTRRSVYVEPFLGGASVWENLSPSFQRAIGMDAAPDLMLAWQAAADGWVPPTRVTPEEYADLRHASASALRGFVGFSCSWGGKWFGGYARGVGSSGRIRNYAEEASRRTVRIAKTMSSENLHCADYRDLFDIAGPLADAVVYADPPYAGTTGYRLAESIVGKFDHDDFWSAAAFWADEGAHVFVSEYTAPEGWEPILELDHYRSLGGGKVKKRMTEKLWVRSQ